MTQEGTKRKLTAILSADVKEYSRLMSQDERGTIRTLTAYKEAMSTLIQEYKGRVVDSPGDNLLAEFGSVVDAVNCAVEIQRELAERNAELPPARQMEFRIGINLGDVVEEEGRIYGDGVNIAARVEGLAEGGGICISGTAYDQVESKLGLEYEYLGEQEVKNIERPVRVYRVLSFPGAAAHRVIQAKGAIQRKWRKAALAIAVVLVIGIGAVMVWNFLFRPAPSIEPASVERMAFPLPDKPSIAVLPFVNMSDDPKQEYFSDGLTDQIISTLSKLRNLFVIARNSVFTYKGKPVKVQKVAEDLGVKYVLEGGVQRTADRIRITAQLIDATSGHHVWSERYDRELKDIFAIQDDITMEITKALRIKLIAGEQARLWQRRTTTNLKAYEKSLEGMNYLYRGTKEDNTRARQLFEEAIALDSGFAGAHVGLGWTHFWDARFGWSTSPAESAKMAFKYAEKVLEWDDTEDNAHCLLSALYLVKRQYEKAVAAAEHALSLNPNGAIVHNTLAGVVGCSGRWVDSIVYGKKSIRLDPFPPLMSFHWLGRAYFMTGQYDEAILTFKRALDVNPNYLPAHAFLAACYSSLDRKAEAAAEAEEVLRINPKFCLESYAKTLPYKNKADIERYLAAIRKAGLPEKPPLPLPDKPSIAVLPFVNMSDDPKQEFFSDGMTEEIITALAKVPHLFVVARNSTFAYKGKSVNVQKVSEELGVRYVMEGSVRKAGDRLRITAQLIDALTGHHQWAERYDRDLKDIFALQDEITMKVLLALEVKLTEGEQARLYGKGTDNLEAYLKVLQGREHKYRLTKEDNAVARQMFEEAIALDPEYAMAYRFLAGTHMMDVWFRSSKSSQQSLERGIELAQKAIALDDSLAGAYGLLGQFYTMKRQHEKGIAEAERAVALDPNSADAHAFLGQSLHYAGRHEEATALLKKAIRLNPIPPNWYLLFLGHSYRAMGRCEEAIAQYREALHRRPNNLFAYTGLAATYSLTGREEEARVAAGEVLRIQPKFSLEYFAKTLPFKNQADKERYVGALRKAGLK